VVAVGVFVADRELVSELDVRVGFVETFAVEHAARLTAIKQRLAVRQERPRSALSVVPCRVARPGDVLVMGPPAGG
jgi:hypothetical protein